MADDFETARRPLEKELALWEQERRFFKSQRLPDTPQTRKEFADYERIIAYLKAQLKRLDELEKAAGPRFAPGTKTMRDVSTGEVIGLLMSAAGGHGKLAIDARCLLSIINDDPGALRVVHPVHVGGGKERPDYTPHITISIGRTYHLRLTKKGHLFEVSPPPREHDQTPDALRGPKVFQGHGAQGAPRPRKPKRER